MTWSWICSAVVEIDFLHWISSLPSLVPPPFNDRKVENWLWEKWDWLLFKYCLCLTCKKRMSQIQQCISFWKAPHKLNLFYFCCNVWNSNWVCFGKRLSRHRAGGEFRRPIKEFKSKFSFKFSLNLVSNWVCFGKRLSRHRAGGEFRPPIKEF